MSIITTTTTKCFHRWKKKDNPEQLFGSDTGEENNLDQTWGFRTMINDKNTFIFDVKTSVIIQDACQLTNMCKSPEQIYLLLVIVTSCIYSNLNVTVLIY